MNKQLQRFHTLKVLVGVPSTGLWFADFGTSLSYLMAYVTRERIEAYKDQQITMSNMKGSILSKSRFLLVEEAKAVNADYLLFIDSDQTFPRAALHKLISRNLDCIGANVATKQLPAQPTARNKGPRYEEDKTDWTVVYTDEGMENVEKVDRLGCGVLMLSKAAYSKLEPKDWNTYWREDVQAFQGEDWSMMDALEAKGVEVYVDHALSQHVGHVGFYTFTHADVGEVLSPEEYKRLQEKKADVRDSKSRPLAQAIAAM